MATIQTLNIHNFRNLSNISTTFSPSFNLVCGVNGAGKTSLLEAIYYLGLGKSFRASLSHRIIQHEHESFVLAANITTPSQQSLGIERKRTGERQIKLNGDLQTTIAEITKQLPIQFMSPISYRFFHDGPKIRRQYLDWALFHVEPNFLNLWQRFQRVLRQRNAALKQNASVNAWNAEYITTAIAVDQAREKIFAQLTPLCLTQLKHLLPNFEFNLRYKRGWANNSDLSSLLNVHLMRDQQLGYTYYGPQRADFILEQGGISVQDNLSQGQQKLAAYALHLSLGMLLHEKTQQSPIYLIDDLPSELDANSRGKIIAALIELDAQVFVTSIDREDLKDLLVIDNAVMFHVEHGGLG